MNTNTNHPMALALLVLLIATGCASPGAMVRQIRYGPADAAMTLTAKTISHTCWKDASEAVARIEVASRLRGTPLSELVIGGLYEIIVRDHVAVGFDRIGGHSVSPGPVDPDTCKPLVNNDNGTNGTNTFESLSAPQSREIDPATLGINTSMNATSSDNTVSSNNILGSSNDATSTTSGNTVSSNDVISTNNDTHGADIGGADMAGFGRLACRLAASIVAICGV